MNHMYVHSGCSMKQCNRVCAWTQVTLEFPVDDTAGGDNEDALTDMVFYVPKEATGFSENGEEQPAKVLAKSPLGAFLQVACVRISCS